MLLARGRPLPGASLRIAALFQTLVAKLSAVSMLPNFLYFVSSPLPAPSFPRTTRRLGAIFRFILPAARPMAGASADGKGGTDMLPQAIVKVLPAPPMQCLIFVGLLRRNGQECTTIGEDGLGDVRWLFGRGLSRRLRNTRHHLAARRSTPSQPGFPSFPNTSSRRCRMDDRNFFHRGRRGGGFETAQAVEASPYELSMEGVNGAGGPFLPNEAVAPWTALVGNRSRLRTTL